MFEGSPFSNGSSGNRGVLGIFASSEACLGLVSTRMLDYSVRALSPETWEESGETQAVVEP